MWEIIKYCLRCFVIVFCMGFGEVHVGLTFTELIVGLITMGVLTFLGIFVFWIIMEFINIFFR